MMNHIQVRWPLIACLTCALLLGGIYAWYESMRSDGDTAVVVEPSPLERIKGSILVTGITDSAQEGAVYELSLGTGSLRTLYRGEYFAPAQSTDGKVAVITEDVDGMFGLFVAKDVKGTDAVRVESPVQGLSASFSAWSPDGRYLAYVVSPDNADVPAGISEARIVLLDTATGEQRVVGQGVSPAFMPDGSIVYIGEFGVYRMMRNGMNIVEPLGVVGFHDTERRASRATTLAVSPDGTRIAIADPEVTELRMYDVNDSGEVVNERVLIASASMPTFSPDGLWLAYVAYVARQDGVMEKAAAVLDTTTMESVVSANLTAFQNYMFSFGVWN